MENMMDRISRRTVYEGRIVTIYEDHMRLDGGREQMWTTVQHPGAVVMVPVDADGNILLVRQPRPSARDVLLELPAGTREEGEEPAVTARRELQEEIAHDPQTMTPLGGFYSAPGFCDEFLHLFLATDLQPVEGVEPDEDEEITVVPTLPADIPELIRTGEIRDAKSIAGLLRYLYMEGGLR